MPLYSEEALKTVLVQAEAAIKRFPFGVLTTPVEPVHNEPAEINAGSCSACSGAKHPAAHEPPDDDHTHGDHDHHHGDDAVSPLPRPANTAEIKDIEKGEPQTPSLI